MGSLQDSAAVSSVGQYAYVGIAVIMAFPLFSLLGGELIQELQSMSSGEAISVFGIVGGAAGLVAQLAATRNLERVNRGIHVAELVPAVLSSVVATGFLTFVLLPPNFTAMHDLVQA